MDSGRHALADREIESAGNERAQQLAEFTEKAEALGVVVWHTPSLEEAGRLIAAWAEERATSTIVASTDVHNLPSAFLAALVETGLEVVRPGDPRTVRDAPLGVSVARLAVAETGSVLLAEAALPDRSVSMLTLALAVVCPSRALVAGLDEATEELRRIALQPGPSFVTLVTGPSRTADIERVLTVGVQGPGVVAVVFVDDL